MAAQRAADLARRQDLVDDVFGLGGGVVDGDVLRFLCGLARPHERLTVLPRALRHQRIGAVENLLRGAVILARTTISAFGV